MTYKQNILAVISETLDNSTTKGVRKYGHTLEDCDVDKYDWQHMAIEELINALQHQQKEIQRLREVKGMSLLQYQELSKRTLPPSAVGYGLNVSNYAMGLAGEAGEVVDLLKKHIHHGHELSMQSIVDEIGDVLHYAAGLCTMLGVDFESVATSNIRKLEKRYPNGFSKEDSVNRSE